MADIKKIRLSGVTYNIVDESAIHSLDGYWNSGQTENAITAATSALAESIAEQGYQTSGDVQNAISGKLNTSDAISSVTISTDETNNRIALNITKGNGQISTTYPLRGGTGIKIIENDHSINVDTTVIAQKTDIPSVSGYADAVKYDSNAKEMKFYHGGTGGTEVFSFDASPFLIDGMVDNVEIKDVTISGESVTCLVISFNTDAGKQEIDIPLTEIFDASNYYTTAQTNSAIAAAISGKADSSAVTEEISAAVSGKQDTLISGTSIKTINNESLLGSGNITIEAAGTVDQTIISGSTNAVAGGAVYDGLAGKQATLVSGTNIKTVGTQSLLGSGNVALMTASIGTGNDSETLIFDFA